MKPEGAQDHGKDRAATGRFNCASAYLVATPLSTVSRVNGKPRTLPAGFLWLPTSRCIAHGWGLLSSLWG